MTDSGVLLAAKIAGRARTKGSLKTYCMKDRRHTIRVEEQVAESGAWRRAVARGLREAQLEQHGRLLKYDGPVEVRLVFFLPREKSVNGGPIPTHDTEWPTAITVGDIDKLTRNVLDAMLTPAKRADFPKCSALLADDSQVVLLTVGKFWVPESAQSGVQVLVLKVRAKETERSLVHDLLTPAHTDPPMICGCPYFRRNKEVSSDSELCGCGHGWREHEFGDGACAERS